MWKVFFFVYLSDPGDACLAVILIFMIGAPTAPVVRTGQISLTPPCFAKRYLVWLCCGTGTGAKRPPVTRSSYTGRPLRAMTKRLRFDPTTRARHTSRSTVSFPGRLPVLHSNRLRFTSRARGVRCLGPSTATSREGGGHLDAPTPPGAAGRSFPQIDDVTVAAVISRRGRRGHDLR